MEKHANLFLLAFLLSFFASVSYAQKLDIAQSGRFLTLQLPDDQYEAWSNDAFMQTEVACDYTEQVYASFKDNFDFVIFVRNEADLDDFSYYGMSLRVSNDEDGFGVPKFDLSEAWGSSGRLKSVIHLTANRLISNGPSLHEMLHHWANEAIPTTYSGHWGYTGGSTPGQIGGFAQSTLMENVGGVSNRYGVDSFGEFANGGNYVPYNELELYLMGMIPLSDVKPFTVFNDVSDEEYDPENDLILFTAGERTDYTQDKLKALLGERTPDYTTSQKDFTVLFIVVTHDELTPTQYANIDSQIEDLCRQGDPSLSAFNFYTATGGRGTLSTGNLHEQLLSPNTGLTLTSPASETSLAITEPYAITWSASVGGKVRIDLYQGGSLVQNVAEGVDASAGSYEWTVATEDNKDLEDCFFKITSEDNPFVYSYSPSAFDIYMPQCTVSGKVLYADGRPIAGAVVSTGLTAPTIMAQTTDEGISGYLVWTHILNGFVPTTDYVQAVDIKAFVSGNPGNLVVGVMSADYEIIGQQEVAPANVDWTHVVFSRPVAVEVGQQYYAFIYDPNLSVGEGRYFYTYYGDDYDMVYRVWGVDGLTSTSGADGTYSISLPVGWTGNLNVVGSDKEFSPVSIVDLSSAVADADFVSTSVSSLPEVSSSSLTVSVVGRDLHVDGAEGAVVVYSLSGRVVASAYAQGKAVRLALPGSGLYVVKCAEGEVKVAVR